MYFQELVFIGMKPAAASGERDPQAQEARNAARRKLLQAENRRELERDVEALKGKVQETEGLDMRETVQDKINAWFVENRHPETGEYPDFPDVDEGGRAAPLHCSDNRFFLGLLMICYGACVHKRLAMVALSAVMVCECGRLVHSKSSKGVSNGRDCLRIGDLGPENAWRSCCLLGSVCDVQLSGLHNVVSCADGVRDVCRSKVILNPPPPPPEPDLAVEAAAAKGGKAPAGDKGKGAKGKGGKGDAKDEEEGPPEEVLRPGWDTLGRHAYSLSLPNLL